MNPKSTDSPFQSKPCIQLIATGGTIAGLSPSAPAGTMAAAWSYQSAQRSGESLLRELPDLAQQAHWRVEQPYSIGSQHLTPAHMLALRHSILNALNDDTVQAVLVTHGTDTLEDMMFFLYLTLPVECVTKPIVLTASMLPSDHPQADGPANLRAATQRALACLTWQASSPIALPSNVLLGAVMQGVFTPAVHVRKQSTAGLNAFDSLYSVPVSSIALPVNPEPEDLPICGQFAQFDEDAFLNSEVVIMYCTPNIATWRQLNDIEQRTKHLATTALPQCIVMAAPGYGNIPEACVALLEGFLLRGVNVVRASRIAEGGVEQGGEFDALDRFRQLSPNAPHHHGVFSESGHLSLAQLAVLYALK